MDQAIRERLRTVLVRQMSLDTDEIEDDTSLIGRGLGLDSVDIVALVVKIEDEFDVFFEAEELATVTQNFGTLAAAVEKKVLENLA